jgi:hypothetical protein
MLWIVAGGGAYRRAVRAPAGGARIDGDGIRVRVRLSETRPLYVGALVAGGIAFAGVFIIGFGFGFNPRMPIMLLAWSTILGGGLLAYLYCRKKLAEGHSDLVIDDMTQTVSLPQVKGRQAGTVVPIRSITAVEVEQISKRDSDGDVSYHYVPVLMVADEAGSPRREKLVEWCDQAGAEELAEWLRQRLRVQPPKGDFA